MIVFMILGIMCILHYIFIVSCHSTSISFVNFWLFLGVFFLVLSFLFYLGKRYDIIGKIPAAVKVTTISLVGVGILIFLIVLGFVLSGFRKSNEPNHSVDCIVVLGTKVNGETPTKMLKNRLDAAGEYLLENESTKCIVSGGLGNGETISEAEAMQRYLVDMGIDSDRIIKEDSSKDTQENLKNSYKIIEALYGEDADIAIVTNNFHVYRAVRIAHKMNYPEVSSIAANTDKTLVVHYTVRECIAIVKEFLLGHI